MRVDVRWHAGDPERAKANARELVQIDPDILIVNGSHALTAARLFTSSVSIVFVVVADPIGAALLRPGDGKPSATPSCLAGSTTLLALGSCGRDCEDPATRPYSHHGTEQFRSAHPTGE